MIQYLGRGRSGLHRAGCWLTASRGDSQESATENRPPMGRWSGSPGRRPQVRVKRCGKSAPAPGVTRAAWQTPPGARSNVGRPARPMSPGRPLRWMTTHPGSRRRLLGGQDPAYRPAHSSHPLVRGGPRRLARSTRREAENFLDGVRGDLVYTACTSTPAGGGHCSRNTPSHGVSPISTRYNWEIAHDLPGALATPRRERDHVVSVVR